LATSCIDPLLFSRPKVVLDAGGSGVTDLVGECASVCASDTGDCVGGGGDSDTFVSELLRVLVAELVFEIGLYNGTAPASIRAVAACTGNQPRFI
jgi:hypothetical protein